MSTKLYTMTRVGGLADYVGNQRVASANWANAGLIVV